jgi:rod shape-determining protein MreD
MNELTGYVLRFVGLVVLQALLVDNVNLGSYINPFPYIYFILLLPVNTGRLLMLLIGFALGLTMDTFSDTGGIHTAACTLIAFYRPFLLKAQSPRDGFELHAVPHVRLFGLGWFVSYAALLTAIHHSVLFFMEVFRMTDILHTVLKIVLSGTFTVGIILLMEMMVVPERRRK